MEEKMTARMDAITAVKTKEMVVGRRSRIRRVVPLRLCKEQNSLDARK